MSGIFGVVHRDGSPFRPATLVAMREVMAHWGPDGCGVVATGSAGFGQMRLWSTRESPAEAGPWWDQHRGVLITASGRIDNRTDLLPTLAPDDRPAAISDSELLRRAYGRWGRMCVERINGDWSLAAWHEYERHLFLARDQFGDTPFYYFCDPDLVVFASDFKAVVAVGPPGLRIDELYVAQAAGGWPVEDGEATVIESIRRLPPGHTLTATATRTDVHQYWSFTDFPPVRLPRRSDYVDAFRELFDDAVRACLRAPSGLAGVPDRVAVLMSGGLDSTSVAATAASIGARHVAALTSVPVADTEAFVARGDESGNARLTALYAGLELHLIEGVRLPPVAAVRRAVDILPEPALAGASLYWVLDSQQTASDMGCRILLTGVMGNPGMSWFGDGPFSRRSAQCQGTDTRLLADAVARARRSLARSSLGRALRSYRFAHVPLEQHCRDLPIHADLAARLDFFARRRAALSGDRATGGRLRILRRAQVSRGNGAVLGAAHGLEIRDPTADIRVLAFTLGIPDDLFFEPLSATDRWLIRAAMDGRLPDQVRKEEGLFTQSADLVPRLRVSSAEVDDLLDELANSVAKEFVDVRRMAAAWRVIRTEDSPEAFRLSQRILMQGAAVGLAVAKVTELCLDNNHAPLGNAGGQHGNQPPFGRSTRAPDWNSSPGVEFVGTRRTVASDPAVLAPTAGHPLRTPQDVEPIGWGGRFHRRQSAHTVMTGGDADSPSAPRRRSSEPDNEARYPGRVWGAWRLEALRSGLAAAVGVPLLGPSIPEPKEAVNLSVAVVGGGLAGMATAYFLHHCGFAVEVFEADRIGGRVYTEHRFGRLVELGAELIGENHAVWAGLAETFGLQLRRLGSDATEQDAEEGDADDDGGPVVVGQRLLSTYDAAEVHNGIDIIERMLADCSRFVLPYRPWAAWAKDTNFPAGIDKEPKTLDRKSLAGWVRSIADEDLVAPRGDGTLKQRADRVRRMFLTKYEFDNVVPAEDQSLLGVLAAVQGGGGLRYALDTETHRCRQGNDMLAKKLAEALGDKRVHAHTPIKAIGIESGGVKLAFADAAPSRTFDYVVLAVPPPAWMRPDERRIEVSSAKGATLDKTYALSGGNAVKFFAHLADEFWNRTPDRRYDALTTKIGETWEGRRDQAGKGAILASFAGDHIADVAARDVANIRTRTAWDAYLRPDRPSVRREAVEDWYAECLVSVFPDYREDCIDTRFVWWNENTDNWVGWAYACPAPGEVAGGSPPDSTAKAELLGRPFEERLVFAGEHTCPSFYGYMEGALESGLLALNQILNLSKRGKANSVLEALQRASWAAFSWRPHRFPGGSYLWSSADVRLELTATGPSGEQDTLTIRDDPVTDIQWQEGKLAFGAPLDSRRMNALLAERATKPELGDFVPVGTYLSQSSGIAVQLRATCSVPPNPADTKESDPLDITVCRGNVFIRNTNGNLRVSEMID